MRRESITPRSFRQPADGPRWLYAAPGRLRAPWRVVLFAACTVLSLGIAGSLIDPLAAVVSRAVGEPVVSYTWTNLVAVWAATVIALRLVDNGEWSAVALGHGAWHARSLWSGVTLGALLILMTAALLALMGLMRFETVPDVLQASSGMSARPGSSGGSSFLAVQGSTWLRLLLMLAPAALAEELIFRGYLWAVFEGSWGPHAALWGTSLLFGFLHLQNPGAGVRTTLLVVLAGAALGTLRARTGSLPAAWLAHLAWNWCMAAVIHVPVSGVPLVAPGYRGVMVGPAWLTGGPWGPEGGVVAGVVLGAALLVAWRRGRAHVSNAT